jgi:hypothetical protein
MGGQRKIVLSRGQVLVGLAIVLVVLAGVATFALERGSSLQEPTADFERLIQAEHALPDPPSWASLVNRKAYDECKGDSGAGPRILLDFSSDADFGGVIDYYRLTAGQNWEPFGFGAADSGAYVFKSIGDPGISLHIADGQSQQTNVPGFTLVLEPEVDEPCKG